MTLQRKAKILFIVGTLLVLTACGIKKEAKTVEISENLKIQDLTSQPLTLPSEEVKGSDGTKWFRTKRTFYGAFDTVISLTFYTKTEEEFKKYADFAEREYERLHQLYDKYHAYPGITNLYMVNNEAHKQPLVVEKDLFDLLQFAVKEQEFSHAKTQITMGALLDVWHKYREAAGVVENGEKKSEGTKAVLPSEQELQEATEHENPGDLVLDPDKHTVFFKDGKISLDVGAVAKGYATQKIVDELRNMGLEHGLISAGGNVCTIGLPVDGRDTWSVGIQSPKDGEQLSDVLKIGADKAVVTSGDYQRYYEVDGKKYHHIIDPETRYPGTLWHSVTVIASDSGLADFLSTALFLATPQEQEQIRNKYEEQGISIEYLGIDTNQKEVKTSGIIRE